MSYPAITAKLDQQADIEPPLEEMLEDLIIQQVMQCDGISKSEVKEVISQARARLSFKLVAKEEGLLTKDDMSKDEQTDMNEGSSKAPVEADPNPKDTKRPLTEGDKKPSPLLAAFKAS